MKKASFIVSILLMAGSVLPVTASASVCGNGIDFGTVVCSNGSPENVQNYGGFTNSQLPHIMPGQRSAAGDLCPAWFTNYCVDISKTPYYLSLNFKSR